MSTIGQIEVILKAVDKEIIVPAKTFFKKTDILDVVSDSIVAKNSTTIEDHKQKVYQVIVIVENLL